MRKNVDPNMMAPCGCSLPPASGIAERVRCANAVKNQGWPRRSHAASASCSGQSPNPLLNPPWHLRFLPLPTPSCGEIGVGVRRDANG